MKKHIIIYFILILFTNCNPLKSNKSLDPLTKDQINGELIYKRITKETNYKKYKMWPGHEGFKEGQSPHGRIHRIFINDILYNSLPNKSKIAPIGSIIIKENYDIEKQLKGLTVMVKVKDFNPKINNWYWVSYDNNGNTVLSGKVPFCSDCHSGKIDNDYIIVRPLDK